MVRPNEWPRLAISGGLLACLLGVTAPGFASAQEDEPSARVWLDRGEEPVLARGDQVRVYYRTSHDAYMAIFRIDTNGTTQLVFPRSPDENHRVRSGRDYRLVFPGSTSWYVEDEPGMGYYFVVASPEPFDFSGLRYSHYDGGWDLTEVGRTVYSDPYVAMDDYVARMVPDWEYVPYALDFVTYHVDERHEYPRFLCYDCHGFRPYGVWNPYLYECTSFRVIVYSDPYYYPAARYRGSTVVYVRPPAPRTPRFVFKERAAGESGAPLVTRRSTDGGTAVPRRSTGGIGSGGRLPVTPIPSAGRPTGGDRPAVRVPAQPPVASGTRTGRPSDALPGRAVRPPTTTRSGGTARPPTDRPPVTTRTSPPTSRERPVLRRRPPVTKPGGGASSRPTARPTVRKPTGGGSSARPAPRPAPRPAARPKVRKPGGGGSSARPAPRPAPRPTARPKVRKPGGGTP